MMVLHFDRFANCCAPITAQMKVGEVVQIGENYYLAIGAGAISKFLRYSEADGFKNTTPFSCRVVDIFAKRNKDHQLRIYHKEA